MAALELWGPRGHDVVALDAGTYSIGKSEHAEIVIADDPAVSRVHVIVERVGPAWCIRDLGSTNGTLLNGKRLFGEHTLDDGDEVIVGRTRLVFRDARGSREPSTDPLASPPELTPRERDVLIELCRPLLSGNLFHQPSSVRDIADALVVTQAAVKQHLGRLFDKFGIFEDTGGPRRARLANEALSRGAVTVADIRARS